MKKVLISFFCSQPFVNVGRVFWVVWKDTQNKTRFNQCLEVFGGGVPKTQEVLAFSTLYLRSQKATERGEMQRLSSLGELYKSVHHKLKMTQFSSTNTSTNKRNNDYFGIFTRLHYHLNKVAFNFLCHIHVFSPSFLLSSKLCRYLGHNLSAGH